MGFREQYSREAERVGWVVGTEEGGCENPGLTMALVVAGWGGRVAPGFCSKAGEKVPLCGGNWVERASRDEQVLRKWWDERGWLWPGIVSGVDSLIVLDCDSPSGVQWFRNLASSAGGWVGGGFVYRTPGRGGGLHCVWRWPAFLGDDFRQAKVCLPDGGEVQLRGQGHWTLLCGARRPDIGPGQHYVVVEEPDWTVGPVVAPERLIRAFLRESVVSVGVGGNYGGDLVEVSVEDAWAAAPVVDGRKNMVAGLAWYLAIRGIDPDEVVAKCVDFGLSCCIPPLAEETCRKKAIYACERAERHRMKTAVLAEQSIGRWAKGNS